MPRCCVSGGGLQIFVTTLTGGTLSDYNIQKEIHACPWCCVSGGGLQIFVKTLTGGLQIFGKPTPCRGQ